MPDRPRDLRIRLLPGVHVIGDAAIAGAMPKSAFAANAQAKVCAAAVLEPSCRARRRGAAS